MDAAPPMATIRNASIGFPFRLTNVENWAALGAGLPKIADSLTDMSPDRPETFGRTLCGVRRPAHSAGLDRKSVV